MQTTLAPGGELVLEVLIKAADGASAGGHSQQRVGNFPHLVDAHTGDKHLGQSLGHLWFIAAIAVEDLCVELALAISGDFQLLDVWN